MHANALPVLGRKSGEGKVIQVNEAVLKASSRIEFHGQTAFHKIDLHLEAMNRGPNPPSIAVQCGIQTIRAAAIALIKGSGLGMLPIGSVGMVIGGGIRARDDNVVVSIRSASTCHRRDFRRAPPFADGSLNPAIMKFFAHCRATQEQPAPAHVTAPDKFLREKQPFSEHRQKRLYIFACRNASEQNNFTILIDSENPRRFLQRPDEIRLTRFDVHPGKLPQLVQTDAGLWRLKAAAWRNDLHTRDANRRPRKPARIVELSAEIQSAAEREDFTQRRVADLHSSRQFKARLRPQQKLRAPATGSRG